MDYSVFVYGTLRKDQYYHSVIKADMRHSEKATFQGQLYHLSYGYPALIKGNGEIAGELLSFSDEGEALQKLDQLEGFYGPGALNEYDRIEAKVRVESGEIKSCYLYVYAEHDRQWLEKEGIIISDGDWVKWLDQGRSIYYFAYGSCMSRTDFARTVENFEVLGRAELPSYRLAFTLFSPGRQGGVADIIEDPQHNMEGILYRFSCDQLGSLDEREGVSKGIYRRKVIEVVWNNKRLPVLTYEVVDKCDQEIAPGDHYRNLILGGADLLSNSYQTGVAKHIENLKNNMGEKYK